MSTSEFYLMHSKVEKEVREPGLEPGSGRWQRPIVPLDHSRCVEGLHKLQPLKAIINHKNLQKCLTVRKEKENLA